jgi:hypothetical protein
LRTSHAYSATPFTKPFIVATSATKGAHKDSSGVEHMWAQERLLDEQGFLRKEEVEEQISTLD